MSGWVEGYGAGVPELPDVEGFRRVLAEHAVGRRICAVDVLDTGVLHDVSAERLQRVLRGRRFGRPWRHGKWLVVPITGAGDPVRGNGEAAKGGGAPAGCGGSAGSRRAASPRDTVLLHFGMTGSLSWADGEETRHRHDRVVFVFADGELCYRDMRKLHGLWLMRDDRALQRLVAALGPDAADVSRDQLQDLLTGRRRQVKAALMDQSVLAGLGNLLADEILWRAHIDPRRPCADLRSEDFQRLHARMRTVLRHSIDQGRVPPRKTWLTGRRDEQSGSCPRCGTPLLHGRVGGRGTAWCPHCQH